MYSKDIIIKIRMSSRDLRRFKTFIESYTGDLSLALKRKRKLAMLLGESDDYTHGYKVVFNSFSRIDGYPYFNFKNLPHDRTVDELLKNGELIDFEFKNMNEVEFELIEPMNDSKYDYRERKPGKVRWFDRQNINSLYE